MIQTFTKNYPYQMKAINEIFLDTYQKTAKDTLSTEIRNIILGKVSRLMIDLDKT